MFESPHPRASRPTFTERKSLRDLRRFGFTTKLRNTADGPRMTRGARRLLKIQGEKMGILGWIIFGVIVGAVARILTPRRDPESYVVTILLGIVGAVVGGAIGRTVGWYEPDDVVGFAAPLVGAIMLLVVYRMIDRREHRHG